MCLLLLHLPYVYGKASKAGWEMSSSQLVHLAPKTITQGKGMKDRRKRDIDQPYN